MPGLFNPLVMGVLKLPNRIVMAPLTRMPRKRRQGAERDDEGVLRQRSRAGIILAEASQ